MTSAMGGGAMLLIPLAPQDAHAAVPFIVIAELIASFGVVVYNVTQISMRQAITPERLQGRMNSVIRFIVWGVMPLGLLVGGAIATAFDLRTAIWVSAIGNALAWLPLTIGPVRTLRVLPDVGEEGPERIAETEGEALLPGPVAGFEEP